jgi:hypothetical protein
MNKIRVSRRTIIQYTKSGLTYEDDSGFMQHIEFAECCHNFAKHVLESGDFLNRSQDLLTTSCVAWSNITAKPLFIEFFTEPHTRFEFEQPRHGIWSVLSFSRQRGHKNFLDMQSQINALGWKSYDLS